MAEPQAVVTEAPAGAPPPSDGAQAEPTGGGGQEPTEAGKVSSPPTDIRALHAGFSQKSMLLAAIRDELGLPKTTPDEQLLENVRSLRQPKTQIFDDPELQAQSNRLKEQQWSYVERIYGKPIAESLRQISALARTTDDPEAMAAAFWEAREAQGLQPQATAPAAAPQEQSAEAAAQGEAPPDLEMGESARNDLGTKPIPAGITEGLKGSGNLREAARRLFGGSARA